MQQFLFSLACSVAAAAFQANDRVVIGGFNSEEHQQFNGKHGLITAATRNPKLWVVKLDGVARLKAFNTDNLKMEKLFRDEKMTLIDVVPCEDQTDQDIRKGGRFFFRFKLSQSEEEIRIPEATSKNRGYSGQFLQRLMEAHEVIPSVCSEEGNKFLGTFRNNKPTISNKRLDGRAYDARDNQNKIKIRASMLKEWFEKSFQPKFERPLLDVDSGEVAVPKLDTYYAMNPGQEDFVSHFPSQQQLEFFENSRLPEVYGRRGLLEGLRGKNDDNDEKKGFMVLLATSSKTSAYHKLNYPADAAEESSSADVECDCPVLGYSVPGHLCKLGCGHDHVMSEYCVQNLNPTKNIVEIVPSAPLPAEAGQDGFSVGIKVGMATEWLVIQAIHPGTWASEHTDLQKYRGWTLHKVNGVHVKSLADLQKVVRENAGKAVTITVGAWMRTCPFCRAPFNRFTRIVES